MCEFLAWFYYELLAQALALIVLAAFALVGLVAAMMLTNASPSASPIAPSDATP